MPDQKKPKNKESDFEKLLKMVGRIEGKIDNQEKVTQDVKSYLDDLTKSVDAIMSRVGLLEIASEKSVKRSDYLQEQIDSISEKVNRMIGSEEDCIRKHNGFYSIRKEPLYDYAESIGLEKRDVLNILQRLNILQPSQYSRTYPVKIPHTKKVVRAIKVYFD